MEEDQENERHKLENEGEDVYKFPDGDPVSKDSSSSGPSSLHKDPDDKVDITEKDLGGDQTNTCRDVDSHVSYLDKCVEELTDDENDDYYTADEEEEEDEDEDEYIFFLAEEKTDQELLTTEVVDSKKDENEVGVDNVAVAEREPIVFGDLSEFLPICVVTLDFTCFGYPCYDLRELLKQRLWTQSPGSFDQLIILYNLYKSSDSSLQLITCDGAIQFYIQVYALNAIEKFVNQYKSRDFRDILACMLHSHTIREKMKKMNAQFSVTCHCENLNQWETEYERTCRSFRFNRPMKGLSWNRNYTGWPGTSTFNPECSE